MTAGVGHDVLPASANDDRVFDHHGDAERLNLAFFAVFFAR
jgi:hypothetical protein